MCALRGSFHAVLSDDNDNDDAALSDDNDDDDFEEENEEEYVDDAEKDDDKKRDDEKDGDGVYVQLHGLFHAVSPLISSVCSLLMRMMINIRGQ